MRIVDEWNHDKMKVTVMIMNGRYSVKLEQNLLEQTYKFRDEQISSLEQLKENMTEAFYNNCLKQFNQMAVNRTLLLPTAGLENFPTII